MAFFTADLGFSLLRSVKSASLVHLLSSFQNSVTIVFSLVFPILVALDLFFSYIVLYFNGISLSLL